MLPANEDRCQGRSERQMGVATLCGECTDCLRRTDMPADMQSIQWMAPPGEALVFHAVPEAHRAG